MTLSGLAIIDLFLRFAAVGQLSLVLVHLLRRAQRDIWLAASLVTLCISSYLLLTAPIPDEEYGFLRGLFLLFTDLTPFAIWLFAVIWLQHAYHPRNWPMVIHILSLPMLLWYVYFFGVQQGVGLFHDVNHALGFVFLGHVLYSVVRDIGDDLNDASRKRKMLALILLCLYFCILTLFEFADASIRNHSVFSITNAAIGLSATSLAAYFVLIAPTNDAVQTFRTIQAERREPSGSLTSKRQPPPSNEVAIPPQFRVDWQRLQALLKEKIYGEPELTITKLAERLGIPAHQLRLLLNQHLGFKNFSQFLNAYRIPEACEQLRDPARLKIPILTIALEVGYGSIGPFNRAFKQQMGQTPSEYRRSFSR